LIEGPNDAVLTYSTSIAPNPTAGPQIVNVAASCTIKTGTATCTDVVGVATGTTSSASTVIATETITPVTIVIAAKPTQIVTAAKSRQKTSGQPRLAVGSVVVFGLVTLLSGAVMLWA